MSQSPHSHTPSEELRRRIRALRMDERRPADASAHAIREIAEALHDTTDHAHARGRVSRALTRLEYLESAPHVAEAAAIAAAYLALPEQGIAAVPPAPEKRGWDTDLML